MRTPEQLRDFVTADPLCRRLAGLASAEGRELALVGGWVRDWMLGRAAPDWDLVTDGDPRPLVRALLAQEGGGPLVPLDEGFGIYRTRLAGGLVLDFARAVGDDMARDLARRDLTINALAVRLEDGRLLDPLGGLADLAAGVVRVPSRRNLEDDPLRIVRVRRFAATLGFSVEPTTAAWCAELAGELARPAGERILAELGKLLASRRAADQLDDLDAAGALYPLLGGDSAASGRLPTGRALVRSAEARLAAPRFARLAAWADEPLAGERSWRVAVLLAALLRDPAAPRVDAAAERLRWSKREDALIRGCVVGAGRLAALAPEPRALYRFLRATGDAGPGIALLAPDGAEPLAEAVLAAFFERLDRPMPRLLDGHDLMRELGLPPGRHIAALLAELEEAQALGEVCSREEALAWAARKGSPGV